MPKWLLKLPYSLSHLVLTKVKIRMNLKKKCTRQNLVSFWKCSYWSSAPCGGMDCNFPCIKAWQYPQSTPTKKTTKPLVLEFLLKLNHILPVSLIFIRSSPMSELIILLSNSSRVQNWWGMSQHSQVNKDNSHQAGPSRNPRNHFPVTEGKVQNSL